MAQNLFQAPAALETNALMTVSVQVSLLPSGALRIDPELDARILGHSAEQIDAARITGLQHTEGRSRLALTVAGRASPLALRGHGAQLAWIWLQALAEQGSIDAIPALPCARERTLADIAGRLILGRQGFGFVSDEAHLLTGGSLAGWRSFADLTGMATGGARLLLSFRDGAVWSLAGSAAGIQQQLTDGWLHDAARPPARPPDPPPGASPPPSAAPTPSASAP